MNRILTIIPARSGSVTIKDKNIIDFCGKPLIAYSIIPAVELKKRGLVDEVIVSTDSQKYAEIANTYGASVPFLRPKKISGDKTKSIDVILHALKYLEKNNRRFEIVMLLQPTSPLRDIKDLEAAIAIFHKNSGDSLISCYEEKNINPLVMYQVHKESYLKPLTKEHNAGVRKQEQKKVYVRNGAIYLTKVSYLKKYKRIISDKPLLIKMSKKHSINLDYPEDLVLLKKICK